MGPIERKYLFDHGMSSRPLCPVCSRELTFRTEKRGYGTFCSISCSRKDPKSDAKRKQTNIEKYGNGNPFGSREVQRKIQETNLARYGVTNPMSNSAISSTARSTMKLRYGVEYPLQSKSFMQKFRETNLSRRGVDHQWKDSAVKKKIEETNISRRGTPSPTQLEEDYKLLTDVNWLYERHIEDKLNTVQISSLLTRATPKTVAAYIDASGISRVKWNKSSFESDVASYVTSLTDVYSLNDRSIIPPQEIDIVTDKLLIECDGVYWHSKLGKTYHKDKTDSCSVIGKQLLHIFDLEWYDPVKGAVWKSILSSKLKNNIRIGARECSLIENIDHATCKNFLAENHLQGHAIASHRLALLYDGEIVAIMSFSKSRFNPSHEYELVRYCSKLGTTVVGGASRLLSCFRKRVGMEKTIISYSNRRFSDGRLYETLGFSRVGTTDPNYFYVVNGKLMSRMNYMKGRLSKLLDNYDSSMTEEENMRNHGYFRIWDCGNDIWSLRDG